MSAAIQKFDEAKQANIVKNSILLKIRLGKIGVNKHVNDPEAIMKNVEDRIEGEDPDPDSFKVSKEIFDLDSLRKIINFDTATINYIKSKCNKSFLQIGMYVLHHDRVEEMYEWLENRKLERRFLVVEFLRDYEFNILSVDGQEALMKKLGNLYDRNDYPSVAFLEEKFIFEYYMLDFFATPVSLKRINKAIFTKEVAKLKELVSSADQQVREMVRLETKKVLKEMADRMMPNPAKPGKPQQFKEAFVTNTKKWLDEFALKDVTNDTELEILVNNAKQLIDGVTPKALRTDASLRDVVHEGFAKIRSQLDELMIDKQERNVSIGGKF